MKIRAHHLLCIQGFQGYGYSKSFIGNMKDVIEMINANSKITIIDKCDVICSLCPYNIGNKCQKEGSSLNIKRIDQFVLNILELNVNSRVESSSAISLVNLRFSKLSEIEEVCINCEWREKCFFFLSRRD